MGDKRDLYPSQFAKKQLSKYIEIVLDMEITQCMLNVADNALFESIIIIIIIRD